jgi:PAS domain S-box-containing protein
VLTTISEYPHGISIIDLSQKIGIHRNVLIKYIKILEAQGKVELKKVGTAKYIKISNRISAEYLKEFSSDPVLLFDHDLYCVDFNNQANIFFDEKFKVNKKQEISKILFSLPSNLELQDNLICALKGVKSEGITQYDTELKKVDLKYKALPLVFDDGMYGAALLFEDITDYKNNFIDSGNIITKYSVDTDDQMRFIIRFSSDGIITYMNKAYASHIGYEITIGSQSPRFIPSFPEDIYSELTDEVRKISVFNPFIFVDIRRIIHLGDVVYERWRVQGIFNEKGDLTGYQAEGLDITDIRKREQDLILQLDTLKRTMDIRTSEIIGINQELYREIIRRESIESYLQLIQNAVNSAYDTIFILKNDGEICYANEKASEMTGICNTLLIGRKIDSILSYKDHESDLILKFSCESINPDKLPHVIRGIVNGTGTKDKDVEFTVKKIRMNDLNYFCLIIRDIQCNITGEMKNYEDINPARLSGLWPKFS